MTQPDGAVPPIFGGITNPGLAQWAAMTQQDWEAWMRESVKTHIDPLGDFINMVKHGLDELGDLIIGIVTAITGGHGTAAATDAVAAIQSLVGQVGDLARLFQQLLNGLGGFVGATVADAVAAFTNLVQQFWAFIHGLVGSSGTVGQAVAFLTDLYTKLTQLVDGLGGVANSTVAAAVAAFNKLRTDLSAAVTNLQTLIDGIWKAFTGGTGVGHTVTEAVTAITNWLANAFQKLVDGIVGLAWPGFTVGAGVQGAIDVINGILGIGQSANTAAGQAQADIEAIKSGQAGGYSDSFDYPLNTDLGAASNLAWRRMNGAINDRYGCDGSGSAVGIMVDNGTGPVWYVQVTKPISVPDMKVTAVLSRLPWWNLTTKSGWLLMVQASATVGDKSCYGVEMLDTQARFFSQNAAGTQTDLGARIAIPANAVGLPYSLEVKGNKLTLTRNGIVAATYTGITPLAGRCVGFGGWKVAYVSANDNPLAQFAGISWQPA